jgi:hypothetical protein
VLLWLLHPSSVRHTRLLLLMHHHLLLLRAHLLLLHAHLALIGGREGDLLHLHGAHRVLLLCLWVGRLHERLLELLHVGRLVRIAGLLLPKLLHALHWHRGLHGGLVPGLLHRLLLPRIALHLLRHGLPILRLHHGLLVLRVHL